MYDFGKKKIGLVESVSSSIPHGRQVTITPPE